MRSKHEYELPAIKLDTPRDRYESAYRLVRFFDQRDYTGEFYKLGEMLLGADVVALAYDHYSVGLVDADSYYTESDFAHQFSRLKRKKGYDKPPAWPRWVEFAFNGKITSED